MYNYWDLNGFNGIPKCPLVLMLVRQCQKPPIEIDGWNPTHTNGKIGDVFLLLY